MILHIEDDFLPEVDKVRKEALKMSFKGVDYEGHFYPGISAPESPFFDVKSLLKKVSPREVDVKLEFFRLSKPGEESPAYIHADEICASMASVLYLSPSDIGGTAFWRHKETGNMRLPKEGDRTPFIDDANDESKWDMTMELKYKLNRFVTYPTEYFHSRWPFLSEGFGKKKQDARLIYVCFYDFA